MALFIYKQTHDGKLSKDFGLKDQMQRAAISISSNIAEGEQLGSNKQSVSHLLIARGSTAELLSQTIIAREIGYLSDEAAQSIEEKCDEIGAMLTRLIQVRSKVSNANT